MGFEDLQALNDPTSAESFADALARLCKEAGMTRYLVVRLRGTELDDVAQVFHNAPDSQVMAGMRHWSLVRMLDLMRVAGPPVVFGQGAAPAPEVPGYASGVAAIARELRGACIVYFASTAPSVPAAQCLALTRSALLAAHHCLAGLAKLHATACPLSERELQCLQLFVEEKSSREIGQALGISARTAEHYLESARTRFGVDSTLAAACYAIKQGWIELPRGGSIQVTG